MSEAKRSYSINRDPGVPLSQRMRELVWADGDRTDDWQYNPRAQEFADEVEQLERQLAVLSAERDELTKTLSASLAARHAHVARITALEAQVAASSADTKRLDWLSEQDWGRLVSTEHLSLRAGIDAAMRKEAAGP